MSTPAPARPHPAAACWWSRTRPTSASRSRRSCASAATTSSRRARWRKPCACSRRRPSTSCSPTSACPAATAWPLVKQIQSSSPEVPVVVLTGQGTIASAVECLKSGASDYLLKPADPEALEVALERALAGRALRREVQYLRGGVEREREPLGESPAWRRALEMIDAAAATDSVVLLRGESGHRQGPAGPPASPEEPRAPPAPTCASTAPPFPPSCGRASSSGTAAARSPAPARTATAGSSSPHRGTLFLDEIGAMPTEAQAKLAARDPGRRVPPPGRPAADARGRAHRGRHQRRPRSRTSRTAASAPTSTTGSTCCRSACLRCATGPRTSRCWPARSRADVAARLGRPAPELDDGDARPAARLPVAGQRARAAQRDRARAGPASRPRPGRAGPRAGARRSAAPSAGARAPRRPRGRPARCATT